MRIGNVRTFVIRYPDTNDHNNLRQTLLVRVETTDGVVGWGEGIAMWPEACRATATIIDDGLVPLLQQAGDLTVGDAWTKMRAHTWWYGEGGIACFAYSALDMALWDIQGKIECKPLYDLLGGRRHDTLPAYASSHVNRATRALCVEEIVGFRDQGYAGVKFGLGKRGLSKIGDDPNEIVAFVADLRRELGDGYPIVVDIGNGIRWDRDTGIATARRLAELDIEWLEEPFYPTHLNDYRALKSAVTTPIGSGEREFTVTGYGRLIETGTVDVLGVDPARAEGITGFRKVDELCGAAGITLNAHAWSTAILSAASLHLSLASTNTRLFEFKPFPVVVQNELVTEPVVQTNGRAKIGNRPGLGVDVDERVVERLLLR
jgi:L-alanine-DL-glutamate epimerase-like enolase superfamily enzyme